MCRHHNVRGAHFKMAHYRRNENLAIGLSCNTNFEKFWLTVGFCLILFEFLGCVTVECVKPTFLPELRRTWQAFCFKNKIKKINDGLIAASTT